MCDMMLLVRVCTDLAQIEQNNVFLFVGICFHRILDIVGEVLFSTKASSPYDLAVVQLRDPVPEAVVPRIAQRFHAGLISVVFSGNSKTFFLN